MTIAAMKQALEALGKIEEHGNVPGWCEFDTNEDAVNYHEAFNKGMKASTALRAAIAEQEKAEPVEADKLLLRQVFSVCEATEDECHGSDNDFKRGRAFEAKRIRNGIGNWYQDAFCGRKFMGEPVFTHPAPVPAGMVLVPVEPTPEMIRASWDLASVGMFPDGTKHYISIAYKAMLAASPKPGEMK